ncbi:Pyoverdine/dityrosine biosynthesis protein-domain-containing protein [Dactylonectria macrodidyma]|uniref:Pyoverdine/dityrosine biosynthesis protein-domain-containing protein n=1 Tax=Dactylonectria macrodidyma TaxID=307937 RepID=A0A9P9DL64_9HYPO|nr:Pyoverdine/dityrosine biosynthesis protein-domain-containing protein [Dactylonectria macrodidyma]
MPVPSVAQTTRDFFTVSLPNKAIGESHFRKSVEIIERIYRYQMQGRDGRSQQKNSDEGLLRNLALIYGHVKDDKPIKLCIPAFPFKSPNTEVKVLGKLPDKAEEFALAHLNGLCAGIQDIYPPGAKLIIISDGIVYNDLLGVPDLDVWAYGEALREIAKSKAFNHISFSRLNDLVSLDLPHTLNLVSYTANATNFRRALMNDFSSPDYSVSSKIAEDEDTRLTYCGYLKFLQTDLESVYPVGPSYSKSQFKKGIEVIAKQMLIRGQAFARAVKDRFSDHVRLSIHPSTGQSKVSISLLPTNSCFTTPWHCVVAFNLDGTITSHHAETFRNDPRFELVYDEHNRPSYFREKSDFLNCATGPVSCEPTYPSGLIIRPAAGAKALSIHDIDSSKVRALSEINSPVVLRGFSQTENRDDFVNKSKELGEPLSWKFGLVLEVKDRGVDTRGLNNVLSAEWMPFHYDGLFKTKETITDDGHIETTSVPPRFQFFTAVTPSPKDTGFTLFASSTSVFKYLPRDLPLEFLTQQTWSVSTSSFENTKLHNMPLVVKHPTTGTPCLRYHEDWPESKTKFEATHVSIENQPREIGEAIVRELELLLHDRRVAYYHSWEKGDLLINDNILTMHTRSDFTAGCDRELWRIHFD